MGVDEIGERLGITHQAASARLINAGWQEELDLCWLAEAFLGQVSAGNTRLTADLFAGRRRGA